MWRAEDQALLERLEDEVVLGRLFVHHVGDLRAASVPALPPRAAGLVASARRAGAPEAALAAAHAGDPAPLVRWLETPPLAGRPPELLHHLALYQGAVARALEDVAPEASANAWTRALAAWLALGEERAYLEALEEAVLGAAHRSADIRLPPERVALELLGDLGRRAGASSRELAPRGRAALLALAWTGAAVSLAGIAEPAARAALAAAERHRISTLDGALSVVGEAIAAANARGALVTEGRTILERAVAVWGWAGQDETVEQWAMDQISTIGWELHRARDWTGLRALLQPFRPLAESLAARIEREPAKIAFSSHCAQFFVFLADVEDAAAARRALAERAVRVCPTHRNGRLVLASLLCDEAQAKLRAMTLFFRRDEMSQVEALLARAEKLYPQLRDLPEAKAALERAKRAPLSR